jgi:hypothetical protein
MLSNLERACVSSRSVGGVVLVDRYERLLTLCDNCRRQIPDEPPQAQCEPDYPEGQNPAGFTSASSIVDGPSGSLLRLLDSATLDQPVGGCRA